MNNIRHKTFVIDVPRCKFNIVFRRRLESLGLHVGANVYIEFDNNDKLILKCHDFRIGVDKKAILPFLKEVR